MVELDQFYTNDDIAKKYYDILKQKVNIDDYDLVLEPSAGRGSFFKLFPESKRIGIDIDPKCDGLIKDNFFNYNPEVNKKYIVIGNPPFGTSCSIALRFFNKASQFADVIAFIIPRTFKRISVQNQLNKNFWLEYSDDLPLKPCCFDPFMNAKCCFQIWKKRDDFRELIKYDMTHPDFDFLAYGPKDNKNQPTPPSNADFAIKAYGSNCGTIQENNLMSLRPKSWHFIKCNTSLISINQLKERIKTLDYSISKETVRQDSLGRSELVQLYKEKFK